MNTTIREIARELQTKYDDYYCTVYFGFIIEAVENAINDLHTSNIGYNHNKPIILDFSGYDRGY